ncbi:hypothetical protein BTVI_71011 [Pitangus sulphuratus]|nr:hypothetical protein BTVI_71011 [Pitangus sulphuratus]
MGQVMSADEKRIVNAWNTLLRWCGIKYDDGRLRRLLHWCRKEGCEATLNSAFSISAWEEIGRKLWDAISNGNEAVEGLAPTCKLVLTTLKDWYHEVQKEQGATGEEGLVKSMAELTLTESAPSTSSPSSCSVKNVSSVNLPPARTYTSTAIPPPLQDYPSPASQLIVKAEEKQQETPPSPADSAGPVPTAALPVATKVQNSSSSSLEDSDGSDGEESLKEVELLLQKGSYCKKPLRTTKSKPICLPPAKVVVLPRDPGSFWEGLCREVARTGDWDLCERIGYPSF